MGGCAQVICKYYEVPYKGLEHLWILVSEGALESVPWGYQGSMVIAIELSPKPNILTVGLFTEKVFQLLF